MQFNFMAFTFLALAFAFVYFMQNYKIKNDFIGLALSSLCVGLYILLTLMGGDGLLNVALGLIFLAITASIFHEKGEKKLCCSIQ